MNAVQVMHIKSHVMRIANMLWNNDSVQNLLAKFRSGNFEGKDLSRHGKLVVEIDDDKIGEQIELNKRLTM